MALSVTLPVPGDVGTNNIWGTELNVVINSIVTAINDGVHAPTIIASLSTVKTMFHQAAQVLVQGTVVVPPSGELILEPRVAGYTQGADYSGMTFFFLLGIPSGSNNEGGILGEEVNQSGLGGPNPSLYDVVGTAYYPVAGTYGMFGAMVGIGNINNDWGYSSLSRKIIYTGLTPGITLTAQIIAGEDSGADIALGKTATDVWGETALTPTYDTSPDNPNPGQGLSRDMWIVNMTTQSLMRYTLGRTPQSKYEGIQGRLLHKNDLPMPNTTLYSAIAIDGNGKLATGSGTGNTVTLVDTTKDFTGIINHQGVVLATTATQASTIGDIKAAPDNTGFWVTIANTSLIKIDPTTGSTLKSISLSGYGSMVVAISPNGATGYVWSSVHGVVSINLSSGAITAGPTGLTSVASIQCSPDGLSLIFSSGTYQAWGLAKYPVGTTNGNVSSSATVIYAARRGTQLSSIQVYSVVISSDSKMWFATGLNGIWIYGWVSNMVVFDGLSVEQAAPNNQIGYLSVTDYDGIYIAWSGGTPANAHIFAYPGVLFTCDPTSTNYGMGYAEVLAS